MNGPMKDWDAMGADWRQQAVPTIDVDALRVEAGQQGRRLRRTLVLETLLAVFSVVFLGWIALKPDATPVQTWLLGSVAVLIVPYQAYVLWLRRREWSESGLEVDDLLDVEIRRCTTTLHYWRFGMFFTLLFWLVMHVAMWIGMVAGWPAETVVELIAVQIGYVLMIPLVGGYGVRRCNLARARCQRLAALREQLRTP